MNSRNLFWAFSIFAVAAACQSGSNENLRQQAENTAHSLQSNDIEISESWARPASSGGNSATYLKIYNGTDAADTLAGVHSDVAGEVEIHESFRENDMAGMRPAGQPVIAPDSTIELEPGGLHIMLIRIRRNLAVGDSLPLKLEFTGAGSRDLTVPIQNAN